MKIIAIDTEYDHRTIPFIATVCDDQLKKKLYNLGNKKDFNELKKICESPEIFKVFHSITSDMFALSNIEINTVEPYGCTLIAASLVNENFASRKLKDMAKSILGEKCEEAKHLSKVKTKVKRQAKKDGKLFHYGLIPKEDIEPYATRDPEYTIKLWFYFKNPLKKFKKLYAIEHSLIPIIVKMQRRGIKINRVLCRRFSEAASNRIGTIDQDIRILLRKHNLPQDTNFNSPKQLANVLEVMGIPLSKTTAKGELSTDKNTLFEYAEYPIVSLILERRYFEKQRTTYYNPLLERYTTPQNDIAHFHHYQSGARTGRFSAELIQTIPKRKSKLKFDDMGLRVRRVLVPRFGYRLVSFDYSQIEMRLFAHYSKASKLIKRILEGFDPHVGTAIDLWGEKAYKSDPDFYKGGAKTINFGIIYGMGTAKLANSLGLPYKEGYDILQDYYKKYPVREYIKRKISEIYKTGVLRLSFKSTLMNFEREYRVPQHLAYKAANVEIQGTAAYVMKLAMIRTAKLIELNNWDVHLLTTVHDELIFEVSKKLPFEKTIRHLKEAMEDHVTFSVPILVSTKYSDKSWGECEEIKL